MKAIIIGASGATGKELVKHLLAHTQYTEIICLVRRELKIENPKLKEVIVDFDHLEEYAHLMKADVAFSCLGTTLNDAGSKQMQWKIDFEYQLEFARLAKLNKIENFVLVSSVGANKNSYLFYSKMKGALDSEVQKLGFPKTIIFQPPSLIRPNTNRKGELLGMKLIQFFNRLGMFKNYEPLHVSDLAKAMVKSIEAFPLGTFILKPSDIRKLLTTP